MDSISFRHKKANVIEAFLKSYYATSFHIIKNTKDIYRELYVVDKSSKCCKFTRHREHCVHLEVVVRNDSRNN